MRKTKIGNPYPEAWTVAEMALVLWQDSCMTYPLGEPEDIVPWMGMYSVGFIVRDDKDGIVLAQDHQDDASDMRFRTYLSIARSQVVSIRKLS